MPPPHLRRHARRAADRARRGDRARRAPTSARGGAVDLTRGHRRRPTRMRLPGHLAARRGRRSRRRRLRDRRQPRASTSRAGVVRAYDARTRRAALELGSHPARAADPARADVGGRQRGAHRRGQRLVDPLRRPGARSRLRADEQPEPRLLRRRAPRREPSTRTRWSRCAPRRGDGRLALPGRAPRPLGLRRARAAGARRRSRGTARAVPRRRAGDEDGHLFVLDRETGAPLFPVEERPVPQSDVPGEEASPTQPFPTAAAARAAALHRGRRVGADAVGPRGVPRADRARCAPRASSRRRASQGTLVFPGNVGGVELGQRRARPASAACSIVNTNQLPILVAPRPARRVRARARRRRAPGLREFAPQTRHALRHVCASRCSRRSALPCNAAAVGHARRRRPRDRRRALGGAARHRRRDLRRSDAAARAAEPRRPARRPAAVSCSSARRWTTSCARSTSRPARELWNGRAAGRRPGDADDLPARRAASSTW